MTTTRAISAASSNAAVPDAKTLLIGSHLDTVPNGGRYDGSIGVLAALECLRTLREAGVELPLTLEAINFTDDEGAWRSMFGCRAFAGVLTADDLTDQQVDNAPFRAAMSRAGINPRDIGRAKRAPSSLAGYLELHVEQSARLIPLRRQHWRGDGHRRAHNLSTDLQGAGRAFRHDRYV